MWTDLKDMDYVAVEMVNKAKIISGVSKVDEKEDVAYGLFGGMKEENGNEFVILHTGKNKVEFISTKTYTIMALEHRKNAIQFFLFWKCEQDEQTKAFGVLHDILTQFQDENRLIDGTLKVNTDTYKDAPDMSEVKGPSALKGVVNKGTSPMHSHAGGHQGDYVGNRRNTGARNTSVNNVGTVVYTKEVKTFRRKSKKPTNKDLTKLKKMVILIAEGAFEEPPQLETEGDDYNTYQQRLSQTNTKWYNNNRNNYDENDWAGYSC